MGSDGDDANRFVAAAQAFVGLKCWSLIAGKGTGSRILLDFGPRRRRSIPVNNSLLRSDQQEYESDYKVFVSCAWRLDSVDKVLCGWSDFDDKTGEPPEALHQLEGLTVSEVTLAEPGLDATFRFAGGFCLRIFCDVTNEADDFNYSLRGPLGTWEVDGKNRLLFEPAHD